MAHERSGRPRQAHFVLADFPAAALFDAASSTLAPSAARPRPPSAIGSLVTRSASVISIAHAEHQHIARCRFAHVGELDEVFARRGDERLRAGGVAPVARVRRHDFRLGRKAPATARGSGRGSRSPRPSRLPDGDRACRASRAPRQRWSHAQSCDGHRWNWIGSVVL
jgi:hypothetical protein